MIQEHKLVKGTTEEIMEYITSQPNYTTPHIVDKLYIKKQLDGIGVVKRENSRGFSITELL
jgi:hypothetical protein